MLTRRLKVGQKVRLVGEVGCLLYLTKQIKQIVSSRYITFPVLSAGFRINRIKRTKRLAGDAEPKLSSVQVVEKERVNAD